MKPHMPVGCGRQAGASDQGRCAQAGHREIQEPTGKPFRMAMVFPVSTHNYELRYWLAAGGIHPGFYSPSDVSGQIKADVLALGDAAAADAGDARSGHDQRLLRRRALEPAGRLQRHRRAGHHRLRDLEEQSGEGLRRDEGLGGEESEHAPRGGQGADPRRHVARREQRRQPQGGGADAGRVRVRRRGLSR